jgi:hypothetical protein
LSITQPIYDRIVTEEAERQKRWDNELANLDEPDEELIVSSEYLLSLLNRLPELYTRSKDQEKLEWHKLMFSNASLENEKLQWELKMPFNAVVHCHETNFWLPGNRFAIRCSLLRKVSYWHLRILTWFRIISRRNKKEYTSSRLYILFWLPG